MFHILILNDNKNQKELTKKLFENINLDQEINISIITDLSFAYSIIEKKDVSCIITELNIKNLPGLDIIIKLNEVLKTHEIDIPIIIYTRQEYAYLEEEAYKLGIKQFIVKGKAETEEIFNAIEEVYKIDQSSE